MKQFNRILIISLAIPSMVFGEDSFYDQATPLSMMSEEERLDYLISTQEVKANELLRVGLEPLGEKNNLSQPADNSTASGRRRKAWEHSDHHIGYIPNPEPGVLVGSIQSANSVVSDPYEELKKINIRLDRAKVFEYPGFGQQKNIQLTFETKNSLTGGGTENVAFTQAFQVLQGEGAGVIGFPILQNLNIPKSGLELKIVSLNLKTTKQVQALGVIDSEPFKSGLTLLETAQPAIAPFSALTMGVAKMAISSGEGKEVHKFLLGLDFNNGQASGARLKRGTYVVVQAPPDFNWKDYEVRFDMNTRVTLKGNTNKDLPFNYFIFRVTTE